MHTIVSIQPACFQLTLGSCSVSCGMYHGIDAQLRFPTKLLTPNLVFFCCCRAELQQTGEELLSAFSLANGALEYIPPVGVDGLTVKSAAQKTKGLHLYKSQLLLSGTMPHRGTMLDVLQDFYEATHSSKLATAAAAEHH